MKLAHNLYVVCALARYPRDFSGKLNQLRSHPAEQIAAEIRRGPIGAVIADICRNLGILPSHPLWREVKDAITDHGGSYTRLVMDLLHRAFPVDPARLPPPLRPASPRRLSPIAGSRPRHHYCVTVGHGVSEYDADFVLWSREQADLLRRMAAGERVNDRVDWGNVAEEIESLGKGDRRGIRSRINTVLRHLIKLQISPAPDRPGWKRTIVEQRLQIERLIEDSPSLRQFVSEAIDKEL